MNDHSKLAKLMERIIHKYNQWENKKRTYGTDLLLTKAEIHTVAAVGDYPGINVTALAHLLGVTKGAASQMIYKLVKKGIVEKKTSPMSDTEVVLTLTKDGEKNYLAHKKLHAQSDDETLMLFSNLPDSFYDDMVKFFSAFEKLMDKKLKEQ